MVLFFNRLGTSFSGLTKMERVGKVPMVLSFMGIHVSCTFPVLCIPCVVHSLYCVELILLKH